MLMLDPPDDTGLRALANKAFTLRAVAALESRIRGTPATLLDDIAGPAAFDLLESVAHPSAEQPPVSSTSLAELAADDFWLAGTAGTGPVPRPKPRSGGENASTGGLGPGVPLGKGG